MKGTQSQELARNIRNHERYNNDASVGELYVQMLRDGGDGAFVRDGGESAVPDMAETASTGAVQDDFDTTTLPKEFTDKPFDEAGNLKNNIRYRSGEFSCSYETDDNGRVSNWYTEALQMTERNERLRHNSNTPGKLEGDHAGHLVGDRFGGSPNLDNLVSQSLSQYRKLENTWAKAIRQGKQVSVNVDIKYDGGGL